ncbi:MAG: electron transfer flavoprotein subunit alpha/FixB family protein [Deltaproteobacteria bacterium]|nr:electron transfer flavoprotein subunit alpha/FixB family protein [Deltaproteobacteria bacterium]MBW1920316.1 electron transfer flavoprotein subunit alpha/FixB family protein [Deltaproteobacteria bacterium]MBW1936194.1 electron transfer flavoprotein subunit alpha/FixB family protein [Deltaproteobacteria bacterium]MBW1976977.1 electron transfer flavoprotein subunit alpha/FixB family protein [Deltaproteobacteria bacterium]MBW2045547.1 electron transfer flavoprotein subunit alpha/FixB family pro
MGEIFVVVEHRDGELREITQQMLWKANELCQSLSNTLTAVIIGGKDEPFIQELTERADRVIVVEDERLKDFNGDYYKEILYRLIQERHPLLTMIGHTPWGMDFGPPLSIKTGFPIATDCVDILVEDGRLKAVRQIYTGKLFSKVSFKESDGYLITVRSGAFPPDKAGEHKGEVIKQEMPADLPEVGKEFIAFEEAAAGEVDITQADLLVSIGRGIGEEDNVAIAKELADMMGGVLSCSRPVVDKNWLPKYHQVGTSGKSVKPKVYLALGISGAFQHVAGISGAGTIIAVNKDKKAPIFRVADYGVVDDLFKIVDALKERLAA